MNNYEKKLIDKFNRLIAPAAAILLVLTSVAQNEINSPVIYILRKIGFTLSIIAIVVNVLYLLIKFFKKCWDNN